jgi:hypothetical protein
VDGGGERQRGRVPRRRRTPNRCERDHATRYATSPSPDRSPLDQDERFAAAARPRLPTPDGAVRRCWRDGLTSRCPSDVGSRHCRASSGGDPFRSVRSRSNAFQLSAPRDPGLPRDRRRHSRASRPGDARAVLVGREAVRDRNRGGGRQRLTRIPPRSAGRRRSPRPCR